MQFHLNGFEPGDPARGSDHSESAQESKALPQQTDVLIVGCGPAGLTLAAQLAAFPDISTCIIEKKEGPLQLGQADGIACRSMEMFNAFGFSERVLKESYWVNETVFWKPDPDNPEHIIRIGRVQDTEDGLSEFPHVILNQARVHDFFLDVMANSTHHLTPHYSTSLHTIDIDSEAESGAGNRLRQSHPVVATVAHQGNGEHSGTRQIRARYIVGCDGARSHVRESIGLKLVGDSANKSWGVMDVLAVTNFPDIRFKTLIQSSGFGSIIVIPREGGYLVRVYVELDELGDGERVADKNISADELIAAAQRIFYPHSFDVKQMVWWSVYQIGQRLCDRFDNLDEPADNAQTPRVFIAGDACHTHSPKAGQGMNVSMRDSFNLGWKLASVLQGKSSETLLRTYSDERQAVAKELIDFDRDWARILSATSDSSRSDSAEFQQYFTKHARYTAGTSIQYSKSLICAAPDFHKLATGFEIGTRFHSSEVTRVADAKPQHLGHAIEADGRWRLFAFADKSNDHIFALADYLWQSDDSPVRMYTRKGDDIDSVFDCRFIFQQPHSALFLQELPEIMFPVKGNLQLHDYEKVFSACVRNHPDIYTLRGIDATAGCLVVVRPDQHIADVMPLTAHARLANFFNTFMLVPTTDPNECS